MERLLQYWVYSVYTEGVKAGLIKEPLHVLIATFAIREDAEKFIADNPCKYSEYELINKFEEPAEVIPKEKQ